MYDAYGVETDKDDDDENPFRYCGEYYDSENGLIYLRNRYYDSESGRFMTEDPIRDGGNWYAYCSGNPVKWVDPSGLTPKDGLPTFDDNYFVWGYIHAQGNSPIADNKFLGYPMSEVGCEIVAINNALVAIGQKVRYNDVKSSCEKISYLPATGAWGCEPGRIHIVLNEYNCSYSIAYSTEQALQAAEDGNVFIFSYWNSSCSFMGNVVADIRDGLHTVMIEKNNAGEVKVYNWNNWGTKKFSSFEAYVNEKLKCESQFIIMYSINEE